MAEQSSESSAGKTILIVDDNESIRTFVADLLSHKGFNVLMSANGEDALQQSRDYKDTIHLLLSDIQMPGITGLELGAKIIVERPQIKVILMSGFQRGMLVLNEGWHFLHKPFIPAQLIGLVNAALAQPPMPDLNEHWR